jgi:branched-subunit amino acid transport protein
MMLRLKSGIPFVSYMVLFTIAIPIFMFVEATSIITEKLPFLMTSLATVVRILWNTMNCDVRMLQPFYILAQRHAPAKTLTLDYAGTNPLFLPFIALFNRHWLVALVAFGSILAEVLTVCVSSISVDGKKFIPGHGGDKDGIQDADDRHNTEQTFTSFWTSFTVSMLILIYLVSIAALTYARRAHKFMPRQIGSMASVLAFIHQSKMLVRFVDTEKLDSRRMTRHLEAQGKTFALGWFAGRDGEDHLGIDEEPVFAGYEYGVDRANTRMLGHQIGTWERFD